MTDQHPITSPSQELVRKWIEDWAGGQMKGPVTEDQLVVASQAARWGADQELEVCCEWLEDEGYSLTVSKLRAARRPKPPSLAEEALNELDLVPTHDQDGRSIDADTSVIRRALERLKELEGTNG